MVTSSISSWTPVQIRQALEDRKNPMTGQSLSNDELSQLLSRYDGQGDMGFTMEKSSGKPSAGSSSQDVKDTGLVTQVSLSNSSGKIPSKINEEQKSGRDAVAKELGVDPEVLQKYLDGDGSELTDPKYGIKLTPEEEKAFYANLKQLISDCPFKGSVAYLNPDAYKDKMNPTDKDNQPDCGIGAADYLREHSENSYIKNLTRAQATRLVMLMQPDIEINQKKGNLDSTGCGDKNATDNYPWLIFGAEPIMKKPVPTKPDDPTPVEKPKVGDVSGSYDVLIGWNAKREGRVGVTPGKLGADGKIDYNSLNPLAVIGTRYEAPSSEGFTVDLAETLVKSDNDNDGYVTIQELQDTIQERQRQQGLADKDLYKYTDMDKIPPNMGLKTGYSEPTTFEDGTIGYKGTVSIEEIERHGLNKVKVDKDGNKIFYRDGSPNYVGNIPLNDILVEIPKKKTNI